MATTNTLTPDYMDLDFNTAKQTLQTLLAANPVFKDVNYEGANITVMIELISYLIAVNTYYMNMIQKNQYISTSNLYETTHMLSQLGGYNPMGYRSSSTTLGIDINISASRLEISDDDSIIVNEWSEISNSLGIINPSTGRIIKFVTVDPTTTYSVADMITYSVETSSNDYIIPVKVREGYIVRYDYTGTNIVDNKIYLPVNTYDYDDDLFDTAETIKVYVNDVKWTRISDWFEDSDTLSTAFMFKYDKYGRYYIEFSDTRRVPASIDVINILAIVSSGENGNVAKNIIDLPNSTFLETLQESTLPLSCYTITNSAASLGGSSPETIDEIKNSTIGTLHSQYRTVTKNDYISYLESRADIVQANVWGEQEQSPSGSVQDYNKVYISLVPSTWDSSTVTSVPTGSSITTPISAIQYNTAFKNDISEYLRPRKILTTDEIYVVPELLYFMFKIGLKIKSNYSYTNVMVDVKDKLSYYFNSYNRTFNETISFTTISEYLMDLSITSSTNTFTNIKGLRTLAFRDIDIVVYSPSGSMYQNYADYLRIIATEENPAPATSGGLYEKGEKYRGKQLYPYYVEAPFTTYDNKLRTIQLGFKQFPMIYIPSDTFSLET